MKRVDWNRVFDDFAYLGMTGDELAEHAGVRTGLLQSIATGKRSPPPGAANRIAALWCELTGKPVQFLHMTSEPVGAERPEVPGIASNEAAELSYAQLDAITMTWARIIRS